MARLYRAVFACVGWFAVALQYAVTLADNPDSSAGELTLNFFSYFTILSNILVALALTFSLLTDTGVAVIAALLSVRTIAAVHHRKINAECQNPFIFVIVINS